MISELCVMIWSIKERELLVAHVGSDIVLIKIRLLKSSLWDIAL